MPVKGTGGITLVEVLVTAFILGIIISGIAVVLNVGNLSNNISTSKVALQRQARTVLDWIIKDVRQTSAYQINNNAPSSNHIKFQVCAGHDGVNLLWNSDFIEYTYDTANQTLTRNDSGSGGEWVFSDITASPFDLSNITNNFLRITVQMEKSALGLIRPRVNLSAEVKIRNG